MSRSRPFAGFEASVAVAEGIASPEICPIKAERRRAEAQVQQRETESLAVGPFGATWPGATNRKKRGGDIRPRCSFKVLALQSWA